MAKACQLDTKAQEQNTTGARQQGLLQLGTAQDTLSGLEKLPELAGVQGNASISMWFGVVLQRSPLTLSLHVS